MAAPARDPDPPPAACDPGEWVLRHQEGVWWYLRFLRCPRDLAEDLLQDVMALAIARPFVLRLPDEESRAWLRRSVRNLYLGAVRRRRRRSEVPMDFEVAEAAFEELVETGAMEDALRDCMSRVDGRARQALDLRYGDGLGREEIGVALGLKVQGVKSLLQRVRARLRECVENRMQRGGKS